MRNGWDYLADWRRNPMLWELDSCSKKSSEYNGDAFFCTDLYAVIIDGATDLNSHPTYNAFWFTTQLEKHLRQQLGNTDMPINQCVLNAISEIKKLAPYGYNQVSCSIIIARINAHTNQLEFYSLGDCVGLIRFKDGNVEKIHDTTVSGLDDYAIGKMVELCKNQHISMINARESEIIHNILLANRNKKNCADGYYVLDLSGVGINHGQTYKYDLAFLDNILLMTDGFSDMVLKYNIYNSFQNLLDDLLDNRASLQCMVTALFQIQDKDIEWTTYPRLKFRDDTTAGYLKVDCIHNLI